MCILTNKIVYNSLEMKLAQPQNNLKMYLLKKKKYFCREI